MPDELIVVLTAMTPVGELRASVPLGLLKFDLAWPLVYLLSIAGNMLPVPLLMYGLRTIGGRVERMDNTAGALLRWRTARVQQTWADRVQRFGFFGIVAIVAIPLPLTGAWTGSLAVWALHVPMRRGLLAVAVGVLIAGALVTALTLAGLELVKIV